MDIEQKDALELISAPCVIESRETEFSSCLHQRKTNFSLRAMVPIGTQEKFNVGYIKVAVMDSDLENLLMSAWGKELILTLSFASNEAK